MNRDTKILLRWGAAGTLYCAGFAAFAAVNDLWWAVLLYSLMGVCFAAIYVDVLRMWQHRRKSRRLP